MEPLESHRVVAFPRGPATHADIQFLAFAMWSACPDAQVVQVGTRAGRPLCACIDTKMCIRELRVAAAERGGVPPCGDYSVFDAPAHGRIVRGATASPPQLSTWVDAAAKRQALTADSAGAVHLEFAACSARDRNAALIVMQHVLKWDVLFGSLGSLRTTAPDPHACADLFDATVARVADAFSTTSNATRLKHLAAIRSLLMLPEAPLEPEAAAEAEAAPEQVAAPEAEVAAPAV